MDFVLSTKSEKFKDKENTRWGNVWLATEFTSTLMICI